MAITNDPTFTFFTFTSGMISARDLLNCYLEFSVLVPESQNRLENRLEDNLPRIYRLKQLNAILQCFDIKDIFEFMNGKFIKQQVESRYAEAIKLISNGKIIESKQKDLEECFQSLLQYREEIEQCLWFGSGYYQMSSKLVNAAYGQIWRSAETIRNEIMPIDQIIVSLISPEEKCFPVDHLVNNYDFPNVDITSVDMDWL